MQTGLPGPLDNASRKLGMELLEVASGWKTRTANWWRCSAANRRRSRAQSSEVRRWTRRSGRRSERNHSDGQANPDCEERMRPSAIESTGEPRLAPARVFSHARRNDACANN